MFFVEENVAETHENPVSFISGCRETCVHFFEVEDVSFRQTPHGETEPASFSWTYEEIKEVHKRWWQLRDNAVEIFLTNGRTLLLAFDTTKVKPHEGLYVKIT